LDFLFYRIGFLPFYFRIIAKNFVNLPTIFKFHYRMKAKEIQDMLDFIAKSGLAEVNIETESFKISVKRNASAVSAELPLIQTAHALPIQTTSVVNHQITEAHTEKAEIPAAAKSSGTDESKYITIKSPMIGTFYRTPNPDNPAFVNVGDDIKIGKVVCIIEAMKLFNEVEAEVSGKIIKVLVENASPVEYDQPLFLVDPS
jgi:acetyl-CoA carboxylase biotin carboxyl carrier protein